MAIRKQALPTSELPSADNFAILHWLFPQFHNSTIIFSDHDGLFDYNCVIGVLEVMVSGSGAGRLVVGDAVVPLLGSQTGLTRLTGLRGGANPDNPVNPVTNTLLLVVGKGVRKTLWWEKPDGLDVAIDSDDLLIGELPTLLRLKGWIAFPHTDATVSCINDLC